MRKYELMAIYPVEDDKFKAGNDAVKAVLTEFGATIEKEDAFGDRDLTYEVKRQKRGRFVLFTLKINPAKLAEINSRFLLIKELVKTQFVKLDEKNAD